MKRRVCLFLLATMLVSMLGVTTFSIDAVAETGKYEELTYSVNNGQITITKCNTNAQGAIEIPNTIDGLPVTAISGAFSNCTKVTSITIPENLVTRQTTQTFLRCTSLERIVVSENNPAFCSVDGVLYNKDKTELIMAPNKGTGSSFTVPKGVTTISYYAFNYNTDLVSIDLTDVTEIKSNGFCYCTNLKTVKTGDKLRTIEQGSFHTCTSLEEITLPETLEAIGEAAFCNCSSLKALTIPELCRIEKNPFTGCTLLESITVDPDNPYYCSDKGIIYSKDKTKLIIAPNKAVAGSFTVLSGVTVIGTDAFGSDKDLENIELGSVTTIESESFSHCSNLRTVDLGNELSTIGNLAFYYCSCLEEITFPETLEKIDYMAFWYCTSLKNISFSGNCPQEKTVQQRDSSGKVTYHGVFDTVTANAYYPEGNDTWTEDKREEFSGTIVWMTWDPESGRPEPEDPEPEDPEPEDPEPEDPSSSGSLDRYSYSFANSRSAFGYPTEYTIPLSSYQLIYGNNVRAEDMYLRKTYVDVRNKVKRYWSGNCAGMSATCEMLADNSNGINPVNFNSSAKDPKDLKVKDTNSDLSIDLTAFIEAMHVAQYTQLFRNDRSSTRVVTSDILSGKTNLNQFHDTIKAETDAGRPVLLAMMPGNGQGHAVLGYRVEDHEDGTSEIMIYDNRWPLQDLSMTLAKDNSGNYVSWSFDMDADGVETYGVWGTDQETSNISFVYYDTLMEIWRTRGHLAELNDTNMLSVNSDNFSLYSSTGEELARIENGEMVKTSKSIDLIDRELTLDIETEPDSVIVAPVAIYRIVNNDDSIENLEVSAANEGLGASVSTTADEVVVAVQDSVSYNSVTVYAEPEDTYTVSLKSTLNDNYNTIVATGTGTEEDASISMVGGYLSVEDCSLDSLSVDGVDVGPFKIKASATSGGKISPSGETEISKGENLIYSISPDEGYTIEDVMVDGKSVGAVTEYEFKDVNKDHAIEAKFQKKYLYGDANGDGKVNASDLTRLARHLAKIESITDSERLECADVTHDGKVTSEDLTKLARYIAKIIFSL